MGLLLLLGNSFSGALDGLTENLASAWSVSRRLRSSNVPVIRVRRGSDNAEQDFYGGGSLGAVDVASVAAFCGAGDGFLTTIYDQSGNGRNFVQASTTIQPIVCESGTCVTQGTRLAAKYVAATAHRMSVGSSTGLYNALHTTGGSISIVSQVNDTAAGKQLIGNKNSGTRAGFTIQRGSNESWQINIGRQDVAGVATDGLTASTIAGSTGLTNVIAFFNFDPDNGTAANRMNLYFNGSLNAAVNAQTATPFVENSFENMTIGGSASGSGPYDGTIQEIAIWSGVLSDAQRDAYEANAGTFYGITVA
jgi:hypothetical protein